MKETRHESSFDAFDDQGNRHVLHVFVDIIDSGVMGDPDAELEGLWSIITDDGESVNRLNKGEYLVVATGLVLKSSDPSAP